MSTYLKSCILKGVLSAVSFVTFRGENLARDKTLRFQIENEESLLYLTELRQITAVRITVIPNECTVHELISLADELFKIIQK